MVFGVVQTFSHFQLVARTSSTPAQKEVAKAASSSVNTSFVIPAQAGTFNNKPRGPRLRRDDEENKQ